METIAFFEKKLSLTPSNFNELKTTSIDEILLKKAKEMVENKCSEHGYVVPGSIKLISRSMGYFEAARFTGDAIYYVKLEGTVIYPADGIRIIGKVIRKNKMGLYVNYKDAIRIQVPRDLHLGNRDYDAVEVDMNVLIELKRSKFAINDTFILASGLFITSNESDFTTNTQYQSMNTSSKVLQEDVEEEEKEAVEEEAEEEEEEKEAVEEEEEEEVEEAEEAEEAEEVEVEEAEEVDVEEAEEAEEQEEAETEQK